MYTSLQVLHVNLYIPLALYLSCALPVVCRLLYRVLVVLYAMCMLVCLNRFVTFLISGLWYAKVTHVFFSCACVLLCFLFAPHLLFCFLVWGLFVCGNHYFGLYSFWCSFLLVFCLHQGVMCWLSLLVTCKLPFCVPLDGCRQSVQCQCLLVFCIFLWLGHCHTCWLLGLGSWFFHFIPF